MRDIMELYVCTYGRKDSEKGVVKVQYDKIKNFVSKELFVEIDGKANMAIVNQDCVYVSEQRKGGNFLVTYNRNGEKIEELYCEHFYSWGCCKKNRLYLASFSDGVDSIYDCDKKKMIHHYMHKDNTDRTGRSHYITCLEKQVISVENALQKIYFYKKESLEVENVMDFEEINVRLLSIHPNEKYAYMNTELTNEVMVLDLENKKVLNSYKMSDSSGFSGGNAINKVGDRLAVSVREENKVYVFEVKEEKITLLHGFVCGDIPRDLKIIEDVLFVTCTKEDCLEVYNLDTYEKLNSIELKQPITFHM